MATTTKRSVRLVPVMLMLAALVVGVASAGQPKLVIGAVYPTGGSHAQGGIDEYRGVQLAIEYVNDRGGVAGREVEVILESADSADHAPGAVRALAARGVPVVLGSYGSTISQPAADAARNAGVVFFETGAVGDLSMAALEDPLVFRFPPTGQTLGRAAVEYAFEHAVPALGHAPGALRHGVVYVDDVYGRSVGEGALHALRVAGIEPIAYPYDLATAEFAGIVRKMKRDGIQVLFVSSYLTDGIELRRQSVRQALGLIASIGTSSSYCMHEFGEALGADAVGLFASDKPDGHVLDPSSLDQAAAERLEWARTVFEERFAHKMTAPALTGFAGTIALLEHVLPQAVALDATGIAAAAREVTAATGSLPNGSGLDFTGGGTENRAATSVIWQWVAPGERAIVFPPSFATHDPLAISIG